MHKNLKNQQVYKLSFDVEDHNSHSLIGVFQGNMLKKHLGMGGPLLSSQNFLPLILAKTGSFLKRSHSLLRSQEETLGSQLKVLQLDMCPKKGHLS